MLLEVIKDTVFDSLRLLPFLFSSLISWIWNFLSIAPEKPDGPESELQMHPDLSGGLYSALSLSVVFLQLHQGFIVGISSRLVL